MLSLLSSSRAALGCLALSLLATVPVFAQTPPDGVQVSRDLAYVTNGHERQKLDLYLSAGTGKRPIVVWIHGGGWEGGDKRAVRAIGAQWQGTHVASLNYRLSQDAPFPAQLEDCKSAIRWLRAHADKYGIDSDKVGVWGNSAGGHLAALVGTTGETTTFDKGEHLKFSSHVQAAVSFAGPSDLMLYGRSQANDTLGRLIGGPIQDNRDKVARANPITHIGKNPPPFLLAHGDKDTIVPLEHSLRLEAALKQAGGNVVLHTIADAGHDPTTPETTRLVRDFFANTLRGDAAIATAKNDASRSGTKRSDSPANRPAAASSNDDLAALSDEFTSAASLKNWKHVSETEGWKANQLERFELDKSAVGKLVMMPHASTWYRDHRGVLAFKEVTGDFVVTTDLEAHSRSGKGAPRSQFSLAGIMVRSPRDITPQTWRPGGENYVFLSLGAADRPGTFQFEVKTTINSDSHLQITPGVSRAQIQVARLGATLIMLLKPDNGAWQVHRRYQRTDFPRTLQVGLTCYTDWPSAEKMRSEEHNRSVIKTGNPDLIAEFDFVRYRRPALPESLKGRNLADAGQVTDAQLLQFLGDPAAKP